MPVPKPRLVSVQVVNGSYGAGTSNISLNSYLKLPWLSIQSMSWEVARTAGSSTADGKIQVSSDGTNYRDGDSFTQVTGASGGEVKPVTKIGKTARFVVTIGTTTTFTVKVWLHGVMAGGYKSA
jgi:hypothetical protein